jgi:putative transposase
VKVVVSLEHSYSVKDLLRFLGLPASTYYYHRSRSGKPDRYKSERELVVKTFTENKGRYGHRRIRAALARDHGVHMSGKTVLKLMRKERCHCQIRRRKYRSYKGQTGTVAPNILDRDFRADSPNTKWATDITEFKVCDTKLYLSPVIDLFNGEVIAHTLRPSPALPLVMDMLNAALNKIDPAEHPILHSDQGWQYQHPAYVTALKENGLVQSMSRKANCFDNAAMESFFGHLKEEYFHHQKFTSIVDFTRGLDEYIHWYNHDRIKEKLKGLSPVKYRTQSLRVA